MNIDDIQIMTEELYYMIKARDVLNKIPKDERTKVFEKIYNDIENYIYNQCSHTFIDDYIDYTPDTSGSINYCHKCLMTNRNLST
jgi:hypothetical protein